MKVLHIISGLNDGGAEGALYRLIINDKSNTHLVVSLTDEGKYCSLLKESEVEVYCLHMNMSFRAFFKLSRLFLYIKKVNPDIVQTWMYHADFLGGFIAKLAGCKRVFWNVRHTNLAPKESKFSTIIIAKLCAFLSRYIPEEIICCANSSVSIHEKIGYDVSRITVIGNGYNLEQFSQNSILREQFRLELGLAPDETLIGMVGRYDPQKDHNNLITAISLLNNYLEFKCVLVGAGLSDENQVLKELILQKGLSDNVILLGKRCDIPKVMNGIDLHILSSAFGEAFPNVIAEAMACCTPCVSTDVGDSKQIVGGTGWIVPIRDHLALSEAIAIAINEKDNQFNDWILRSLKTREYIKENFDISKMVNAYCDVWSKGNKNAIHL